MKLSVVIPIYNEAENIVDLLEELAGVTSSALGEYEIVIVDDGSVDNTLSVLRDRSNEKDGAVPLM